MAIAERELAKLVIEEYPAEGNPRLWTHDEYYQMAEAGILKPGERTELIQGRIIKKVSPVGSPHTTALLKTSYLLDEIFDEGYVVRQQMPMTMLDGSEPEPDVLVIRGNIDDYEDAHPGPSDAVLLVEISDSTYRYDKGLKANLYAAASISEYWIVNLRQRTLEIRRDPRNGKYESLVTYGESETVTPLSAPNAHVQVSALLPLKRIGNEG